MRTIQISELKTLKQIDIDPPASPGPGMAHRSDASDGHLRDRRQLLPRQVSVL